MENRCECSMAGLAVVESLILCLIDNGVISEADADGLLEDAENAHIAAADTAEDGQVHMNAARLIAAIRDGSDGVRAWKRLGVSES